MASRRHERTLARRQAIQILYQSEILGCEPAELLDDEASFIDGAKPSAYAVRLVTGTVEHCAQIDEHIEASSENWTLSRMPSVDRAILRLACFEMQYVDEVPISVAINEAVDLARDFGGEDDSPKFVNGVLGHIASDMEEASEAPVEFVVDTDAAVDADADADADTAAVVDTAAVAEAVVDAVKSAMAMAETDEVPSDSIEG